MSNRFHLRHFIGGDLHLIGDRVNDSIADVQDDFGFQRAEKGRENWGGREAEWFRAKDGAWHFMTSDGLIRRWTTPGEAEGKVVAAVDPAFYDNIDLLFSAEHDRPSFTEGPLPTDALEDLGVDLSKEFTNTDNLPLTAADSFFEEYELI